MALKSITPKPRWNVSSLLDLEFLFQRKSDEPDTEFYEAKIQPWITDDKADRPDRNTMSRGLWAWLEDRRKAEDCPQLPGGAYEAAHGGLALFLSIFMAMTGGSLVYALLQYEGGRTINILLFFAAVLGLQWVLLLAGLLGAVTWSAWRENAFLTLAHRVVWGLIDRVAKRSLSEDTARWWARHTDLRRLFAPAALRLTQVAGIAFNVGALAVLIGAVAFLQIRFGWESTVDQAVPENLHQAATVLAKPWSWAKPEWVPTQEQIAASQITFDSAGETVLPATDSAKAWFPFLAMSVVVWGFLPRFILWLIFAGGTKAAVNRHPFLGREQREWWRGMTEIPLAAEVEGPSDDAVALHWGGFQPDEDQLRVAALQQLRLNPVEHLEVGGTDLEEDEAAIKKLGEKAKKGGLRLILVAEGWSLAPRDIGEFLKNLREEIGEKPGIDCFLVGLPKGSKTMTAPTEEEVKVWEQFAADLADPGFYVRPVQ